MFAVKYQHRREHYTDPRNWTFARENGHVTWILTLINLYRSLKLQPFIT